MTVIDYIKTIFISTGTRIWHSYLFGILKPPREPCGMSMPLFDVTSTCDAIIPHQTIFFCFAFMGCKQINFLLKVRTTLVLVRKNTNNESTEANEETKVESKNRCNNSNKKKHRRIDSKCQALTYISYQHQMLKNKIYRKV